MERELAVQNVKVIVESRAQGLDLPTCRLVASKYGHAWPRARDLDCANTRLPYSTS
jgi:hypothetical protein